MAVTKLTLGLMSCLLLIAADAAVLSKDANVLSRSKLRVTLLVTLLAAKCPDQKIDADDVQKMRAELPGTDIEKEDGLYQRLTEAMIECQVGPKLMKTFTPSVTKPAPTTTLMPDPATSDTKMTPPSATPTAKTTPGVAATEKTTPSVAATEKTTPGVAATEKTTPSVTALPPKVSTTEKVIPECLNATSFIQEERKDEASDFQIKGPNSQGNYACDFRKSLQWFRFDGNAGNRMLNKCPPKSSCGTYNPYWTDAKMPTEVGKATTVDAYGVETDCNSKTISLEVIRCSDSAHDYIYRQTEKYFDTCMMAFCGMD